MGHVEPPISLQRIVSGGQTGVDRAALDAAIEAGIPHGGWCPRGRWAEDGVIPPRYQLRETASARLSVRTRENVLDSDGTLILAGGDLTGGTRLTRDLALRYDKPCFVANPETEENIERAAMWLIEHGIRTLNVAGPRESTSPGIYGQARAFLRQLLLDGGVQRDASLADAGTEVREEVQTVDAIDR